MANFTDLDLTGRRALVTGASTGIGAATAGRLAAAGADVVAVSRRGSAPEGAQPLAADLSNDGELDGVVDRAAAMLGGGIDILVNNAGLGDWEPVADLTRAHFDQLVNLNLWAPLRLCQLAFPHLTAADDGSVVMVGSIDSERPSPGAAIYGATKAGLGAAIVALAKEWMDDGVRINQIDPGLIATPMAADAVAAVAASADRINLSDRVGRPEEIAALIHHVVSPAGAFINGSRLRIDGGALTLGPFDLRDR